MKILILSSNLSNEAGGYSESSFLLREKLEVENNEVYLLGFWKSRYFELNYKLSDKINIFLPGLINKFPFSYRYLKKIFLVKPQIIDIQGMWSSTSIFNLVFHFFSKTPYIVTPRGMLEKWALKQSYIKKKIFYFFVEKYHLKFAACLRATSMLEAKTFRQLGFKNIIIIPNSIKIPKLKYDLKLKKGKRKRLLFLGRLHPKKGLSELLDSWKHIQKLYKDWELLICGYDEDDYKKEITNKIEKLDLKRVIVKEFVTGKDKDDLYKSADLFILPSHSENFGLSIAEALSYRVPVITTTNTPWKKLHKYKCGWCINLNIRSIVKTLKTAIELDEKEKKLMGKRGRKWMIKDFSDQSIGLKMQSVYNWILKKGPRPKKLIY
tara:strand:+ start:4610 stop:5746 length:1137 start_codon:yes stop_codon:yes gene_type:complete